MSTSSVRFPVLCLLALAAATPACESEAAPSSEENINTAPLRIQEWKDACRDAGTLLLNSDDRVDPTDVELTRVAKEVVSNDAKTMATLLRIATNLRSAFEKAPELVQYVTSVSYKSNYITSNCSLNIAQSGGALAYAVLESSKGGDCTDESLGVIASAARQTLQLNAQFAPVYATSSWADGLRKRMAKCKINLGEGNK